MTHIEQRTGTAAQWTAENPVMHYGEVGWESDTLRGKLGDGVSPWTDLDYLGNVASVAGKTGVVELVVADVAGAAPLDSPVLTGNPEAPTPSNASNNTRLATTAFVQAQKVSPVFTGLPTAPTPATADNSMRLATTAYVKGVLVLSPVLGGSPTASTPPKENDSTRLATTAFVKAARPAVISRYTNRQSAVPFGGFPANNTRYTAVQWLNVPVPAGAEYVSIDANLDAIMTAAGTAAIDYWLAVYTDIDPIADIGIDSHYNPAMPNLNMSAMFRTNFNVFGRTSITLRIDGSAAGQSVATGYANLRLAFMGRP